MKNMFLALFFAVFLPFTSFGQQDLEQVWNKLLENKRTEASTLFEGIPKTAVSHYFMEQLLRVEQGNLIPEDSFVSSIKDQSEIEYYLYALWNESYLFDSYLTSGFHNRSVAAINTLSDLSVTNHSIKEALWYLKAVSMRYEKNYEGFSSYISKMTPIRNWQHCGVFENMNNCGLDIEYEPELKAYSKTDFNANSNGKVNWYTPPEKVESYQFFDNHSEYGYGVHYAQTFIKSPKTQRVYLRIGNGSKFKLWLNDVEIYGNQKDVITDLDAYVVAVNLPKGTNRLLIKNAEGSGTSYFIVRMTDESGIAINNITATATYSKYNKSTSEQLNAKKLTTPFESYFKTRQQEQPGNFFNDYCLVKTYLRNGKYTEAKDILMSWYQEFPKSSLLRKLLIDCYSEEGDYTSAEDLIKNMELDDEHYYYALLSKFENTSELLQKDNNELKKVIDEVKEGIKYPLIGDMAELLLKTRQSEKKLLKEGVVAILERAKEERWARMYAMYIKWFATISSDQEKIIGYLEDINNNYTSYSALKKLAYYYEKQGKKDEVIALFEACYKHNKGDNAILKDLINKYHEFERYEASLFYIDEGLKNFPYSHRFLVLKGNALLELDRKDEAIGAYRKALKYNSASSSLRKKLEDLTGKKDVLGPLMTDEIYDFIRENRNKNQANHYGYNILLDEIATLLYEEGGGKTKVNLLYEVTSDKGIENFKEYSLNLSSGFSIIKSEIVKPDGSLVPADVNYSDFVFKGLEKGDVIHISYQSNFKSTGRFYKDFVDYYQFDAYHPSRKSVYKLLIPKDKSIRYEVTNGAVDFKKSKQGNHILYEWRSEHDQPMAPAESHMPPDSDLARYLHLSTIDSWSDIANWYSDLVRAQMETNEEVEKAYVTIFPNQGQGLTDDEKAKRIYHHLTKTINYSYVNFRQSGFIPQKPGKTLKTKLGDCKDLSTLFKVLADKVDLKSNLVLILTSDYGRQSMVLPSQDFNHCIVQVNLGGHPQFLELTDSHLPYKSLPNSLVGASALVIPHKSNTNSRASIQILKDVAKKPSSVQCHINMKVDEAQQELEITSEMQGSAMSYYARVFEDPSNEVVKKSIQHGLKSRIGSEVYVEKVGDVELSKDKGVIRYKTVAVLPKKSNVVGTTRIFKLPTVLNAYNPDIITQKERAYPIEYITYENTEHYGSVYDIHIPKGFAFTEIPESKSFHFKKHSYSIIFKSITNGHLRVTIEAKTDLSRVSKEEYPAFKKYVQSILEVKDNFIGYKKL